MDHLTLFLLLTTAAAQGIGEYNPEIHPSLTWHSCTPHATCTPVPGALTLDAEWRWLHNADGYRDCFSGGEWWDDTCDSDANCTATCVLEGAQYDEVYGITPELNNTGVGQKFRQYLNFGTNVNSRVYLLESEDKYQTFTLLGNELAIDVDVSTVECGINAAVQFLAMDADGGVERFEGNRAGAKYGTGYCDSVCSTALRFVGGQANYEGWMPGEFYDPNLGSFPGQGRRGACCDEFGVFNSNAHSYSMSTHICEQPGYFVCHESDCDNEKAHFSAEPGPRYCHHYGCDYNPYRLGATDFYGRGKVVDTTKNFMVVTRFGEGRVTQFFIQDGKKIDAPAPAYEGFGDTSGLDAEHCQNLVGVFGDANAFAEFGGYARHNDMLQRPMVLSLSITNDYWAGNVWLDSQFPQEEDMPGARRGDCMWENGFPDVEHLHLQWPDAKVVWSNIRFGPIGSTIQI